MPKITLDSVDIDPLDTDARRQYMNVFFGQLPISLNMIQEARVKATELQGKHLAGQGLREVSEVYFEYHVDVTIWRLIVKRLMITKHNPWPWSVSLDENDLSQGASPVFREWCQSQTDPRSRDQGPVPQSQAEAEQMALEAFQRAREFDLEGFRLQLIARQWPSEDETPPRDLSGIQPLDGRAMKRRLTGGEGQDAENLTSEDRSMDVSSSSKRARLDNTAAVDTSLKVEDSQDEPLVHLSMVPHH